MGWSRPRHRGAIAGVITAVAVTLTACNRRQVVQGECRAVHGADICSWGEVSGSTVLAFGATVPMAAIANAPDDAPMAWPPVANAVIRLPDRVAAATGFDNLTVFWEPHGHPPEPYLTPHFDFHFYHMPVADVAAIDCADSTKPERLAAGYELPDVTIPPVGNLVGLCVPGMGMHALLATELEATTLFEKTLVLGYYQGRPLFVEPMLTRATLLERRSFTLDVPEVPGRAATGRYPTRFRADYDSVAQSYRFVFSALAPPLGS
jgi:hypothetical protein